MATTHQRLAVLAAVGTGLLVGCGGGSGGEAEEAAPATVSGSTTVRDRPTKQEYLAQGDAICADIQSDLIKLKRQSDQLQAESDRLTRAEFFQRAAAFWADQIRVVERFGRRFERLGSPPGDEERVRQSLKSIEDGLTIMREMQAMLADGREVPQSKVEEYGRTVIRGNLLAQGYGFQVCGRSSS